MDRASMDRLVDDHFMYEATDNIDGVLASFTDDVVHDVVGSPWGTLEGKDAVRPFYLELFKDLKGEDARPLARYYGDDFLVDETLWTGHVVDARFFGFPGRTGHVTFRLLHVFGFRGGLICRENVWFDTAAVVAETS